MPVDQFEAGAPLHGFLADFAAVEKSGLAGKLAAVDIAKQANAMFFAIYANRAIVGFLHIVGKMNPILILEIVVFLPMYLQFKAISGAKSAVPHTMSISNAEAGVLVGPATRLVCLKAVRATALIAMLKSTEKLWRRSIAAAPEFFTSYYKL